MGATILVLDVSRMACMPCQGGNTVYVMVISIHRLDFPPRQCRIKPQATGAQYDSCHRRYYSYGFVQGFARCLFTCNVVDSSTSTLFPSLGLLTLARDDESAAFDGGEHSHVWR